MRVPVLALFAAIWLSACVAPPAPTFTAGSVATAVPTATAELTATAVPTAALAPNAIASPAPIGSPVPPGTPTVRPPSPPATIQTPTAPSAQTQGDLQLALANPPPKRDPVDLALRFRVGPGTPTPFATPVPAQVGDVREFWVSDTAKKRYFKARARLTRQSAHADFWVQEGESVDPAGVDRSLDTLETRILPALVRDFGGGRVSLGDLRIALLNVRVGGIVGYYSSVNEYPRWVHPFSNELPLIAMSLQAVRPGSRSYDSGLAHELEHLLQWRLDPAENTWVNEGTAELAIRAAGLDASSNYQAFMQRPETQLTHWSEELGATAAHYGAADLFFTYVADRFRGYDVVGRILARPERGTEGVAAALAADSGDGSVGTFDEVFLDWVVANWANRATTAERRHGYQTLRHLRVRDDRLEAIPTRVSLEVPQYAARYFELPRSAAGAILSIASPTEVKLVGAPSRRGPFWWSNRSDGADSRLTRSVDLRGASRATLRFSTWHDLERDYDYAYVAVSSDDGRSWTTLPGRTTTTSDPNGANYGHGFTGKSGASPEWIDEVVDLTPYAGRELLLRFEVVTDDAYNGGGFCVDGVEIPEIGWRDDPEDQGWRSEGFVRIRNQVPQRLTAQVVMVSPAGVRVQAASLASDGQARLRLPADFGDAERVGVVVSPHTPLTLLPARFELALER